VKVREVLDAAAPEMPERARGGSRRG
jgi:hypothetical protein